MELSGAAPDDLEMDRTDCHPVLSNDDLDQYEQGTWKLDGPLSVKLAKKNQEKIADSNYPVKSSRPILGNIVERKAKTPVAPGAPRIPKSVDPVEFSQPSSSLKDAPPSVDAKRTDDIHSDVDRENRDRIAHMTSEELAEDLEWIKANLSEETISFLRARSATSYK